MGKRREKTRWSHVDWIQDRGGGKFKRNSAVGPRFDKRQSSSVVGEKLLSEFCCVEELPDGFTKIRSKNLDIIFKRDFYESKMMSSAEQFFFDGEVTKADVSHCQPSFIFDQMDLDEIPEFRPRDGSFTASIGNDSGYSTSLQDVQAEQGGVQYPLPPPQYLPYTPQFYLFSPSANTLIPCEEIIISKTFLSAAGPVYQSPTKAYVAYPVQGPAGHGYITQPFTGPVQLLGEQPRSEAEQAEGTLEQPRSKQTPGIKQLPTDAPVLANYIPGLPVQTNKTKKRRKKKSKSKLASEKSKVSFSSSDSEAREVRELTNDIEAAQAELFDFDHVEASDAINEIEIKLTDDLTNSLVNPPTEDDDIENTEITEDLLNLIEAETVCEVPTNVHCSYSEAVRKEILLKPSPSLDVDECAIPTDAGAENLPVKPYNIPNSKSKNKTRKKKPKVNTIEVEELNELLTNEVHDEENEENLMDSNSNWQVVNENSTEHSVSKDSNVEADKAPAPASKEEVEPPAPASNEEVEPPAPASNEEVEAPTKEPEMPVRARRSRKRKGKERAGQSSRSPVQRVLVVDDQVAVRYCQPTFPPTDAERGEIVSSKFDFLVVRELGYGMSRGVMDMERPFVGNYVPPDRQEVFTSTSTQSQPEVEQEKFLNTNELMPLD